MSVKRVFLATKKDLTIGAIGDVKTKQAVSFKHSYVSEQTGLAGAREVALSALINLIKEFDTKDLEAPVQVYCVGSVADIINNQTYKYWLISGKKNDGTDLNANELKLWKEFHELVSKSNMYFIFKNLNDANFKGIPKFNQAEVKYNKFYYDWAWKAIHKIYPQGPEAPELDFGMAE